MQTVRIIVDEEIAVLELAAPTDEVLPGVAWGRYDVLFTPAFWATRVWLLQRDKRFSSFRLGTTLREEAAACVLGGFGIPAEVGMAAFSRLRKLGLLVSGTLEVEIQEALEQPLVVADRLIRYRFAKQRAERLAAILMQIDDLVFEDDKALRAELLRLPGVGPKTASWIVRNHLGSDRVAILDIHIVRACVAAKVFPRQVNLSRDYFDLEERFLKFRRNSYRRTALRARFRDVASHAAHWSSGVLGRLGRRHFMSGSGGGGGGGGGGGPEIDVMPNCEIVERRIRNRSQGGFDHSHQDQRRAGRETRYRRGSASVDRRNSNG